MKNINYINLSFLFLVCLILNSCAAQGQWLNKVKDQANQATDQLKSTTGTKSITEGEAARALRDALDNGAKNSVSVVSVADGYFKSPDIKIPFPPDAKKVEDKLRELGMGKKVDDAVLSINRAAEDAAHAAKPILVDAIKNMTVRDAINIVKGKNDEGTEYLKRNTSEALYGLFKPSIKTSLDKVNATKHWSTVINTYNKIPFIEKVDPDLDDYVTKLALKGLFKMIAKEEKKIRENPLARVTDMLKKVFGWVDDQKGP